MTKKNLDYIITRYADSKAFMLECLQVKLAFLVRKMIKRKKIENELARKAKIAERKRKEREKELARLKKIHEKRKEKKKEVKSMLKELVGICYAKEDKRREDTFRKENRKNNKNPIPGKPVVILASKQDIPLEAVTLSFKQELFEGCYKKI